MLLAHSYENMLYGLVLLINYSVRHCVPNIRLVGEHESFYTYLVNLLSVYKLQLRPTFLELSCLRSCLTATFTPT